MAQAYVSNNPDVATVLENIEEQAVVHTWPIIGPEKGKVLVEAVRDHDPTRVLEVGTNVGYSAILMSDALDSLKDVITIEEDESYVNLARENIDEAGFSGRIRVIHGDAKLVIPELGGLFDMVFLDARKKEYDIYLRMVEPILKPGAVVVADNVKIYKRLVGDYLNAVRKDPHYHSRTFEVGSDALEFSVYRKRK